MIKLYPGQCGTRISKRVQGVHEKVHDSPPATRLFGLVINCVRCGVGMACPLDRKYCRYGLAFLVINVTLDKLQHAAVKEIPIILTSFAWSKIASGVLKDPKRKMC